LPASLPLFPPSPPHQHRPLHSSPTRRSSDLPAPSDPRTTTTTPAAGRRAPRERIKADARRVGAETKRVGRETGRSLGKFDYRRPDRKSTRLNSSHVSISYAVFCLKKKKNNNT